MSIEPMLEPVDLLADTTQPSQVCNPWLDWVIVGAESGPGARPYRGEWARSIIAQCAAAHVPCFHKQMQLNGRVSRDPAEWPVELRVRQYPQEL